LIGGADISGATEVEPTIEGRFHKWAQYPHGAGALT